MNFPSKGLYCGFESTWEVDSCTFKNLTGEVFHLVNAGLDISNTAVFDNQTRVATVKEYSELYMLNTELFRNGGGVYFYVPTLSRVSSPAAWYRFENVSFHNNGGPLIAGRAGTNVYVWQSTICDNEGDGVSIGQTPVYILNSILCNNTGYGIYTYEGASASISYSDVWNNALGNYYGCEPGEGCISADPLFCDTVSNNYYLSNLSPCVGAGEGGTDIGAFGVGCGMELIPGPNMVGPAQTDVSVEFYLRNFSFLSDTYNLNITDSLGWIIIPTYYQVSLDSGEVDTVTFTVSIPSVPVGTTDKITLNGVSLTDPSVADSADLFVTCGSYNVTIRRIPDVPNDEGKQVRIDWSSFPGNDSLVTHFTVFRRIDSLLFSSFNPEREIFSLKEYPPGSWEMVGTYPAYGETLYSATVPTLKDSTIIEGMYWSAFFIRAGTDIPTLYFDSPVDSGYSLDNLSPSPPSGLLASHEPATTRLAWNPTSALDFDYYTFYRDTLSEFTPYSSNRLGFTIDTTFVDSTAELGRTYYYLVSATDFSGNESDPSNEATGVRYITGDANGDGTINVGDVVYLVTYLYKNGPAPDPLEAGDANCDGTVNVGDVVYLVNYLYKGGPAPGCQ